MNCILFNYDRHILRIDIDHNDENEDVSFLFRNFMGEVESDEEPLPPLVEGNTKRKHATERITCEYGRKIPETDKEIKLFETAHLTKSDDDYDQLPHLIDIISGENVEEILPEVPTVKPIVYKTLLAQGETLEIAEDIVKEIPYIETLFSGRFVVKEEEGIVRSEEINPTLLKVIIRYLEDKKLYRLLACLPKHCDLFQLLELYHFIALPSPIKTSTEEIRSQLLRMPSINVTTQTELVKFAFVIFHAYQLIDYKKERKIRDMVFNTVTYVLKRQNKQSFKPRAKFHLFKLAKKCVWFSYKQFEKIKALRVNTDLDNSDTESVDPVFNPHVDFNYEDCYGESSVDSDAELEMMIRHVLGFDVESYCYDYSDSDDDYLFCCC